MLQIDTWKRVLIWLVCVVGLLMALPNAFYTRVEQSNDARAAIELTCHHHKAAVMLTWCL